MSLPSRALAPLLVLALVACADPAPATKQAAAADKPAATDMPKLQLDVGAAKAALPTDADADVLSFAAAKIMREGHEDRAFELAGDGTVTLAGTPYATLTADGRMLDPSGVELMRVQPDGSVVANARETGMNLNDTGGTLSVPSLTVIVRFGDDGVIETKASGPNAQLIDAASPQLRAQGCGGAVLRACTLITLSYLSALGNPDSIRQDDAPTP